MSRAEESSYACAMLYNDAIIFDTLTMGYEVFGVHKSQEVYIRTAVGVLSRRLGSQSNLII